MTTAGTFLENITAAKRAQMMSIDANERTVARKAALVAKRTAKKHQLREAIQRRDRINIIAEVKRSSPSAGDIRRDADVITTAQTYEAAGAAAISVLTESEFFGGSLGDLRDARAAVESPLLRKDFIVDAYQVYEAAMAGANAVLLIVAALSNREIQYLRRITEEELGLDALVEVHTAEEMERALGCGATIIGINNRNLQTLEVTLDTSRSLSRYVKRGALLISESGIKTVEHVRELSALGFDGFLIGEALMRTEDPAATLRELTSMEVAR